MAKHAALQHCTDSGEKRGDSGEPGGNNQTGTEKNNAWLSDDDTGVPLREDLSTYAWESYDECSSDDLEENASVWSTCAQTDSQEAHLLVLNQCRQVMKTAQYNVFGLQSPVFTHFNLEEWDARLQQYHDKEILQYLQFGWPINRDRGVPDPLKASTNHVKAVGTTGPIDEYLLKEIEKGTMVGPFTDIPFSERVGVSPINVRARPGEPNRPRIILDLSYPLGEAVNDGIPVDSYLQQGFKLTYPTTDELAERIVEVGPQCKIYKRDLAWWFHQLSVCPGMSVSLV